jgi:hypothetical protein
MSFACLQVDVCSDQQQSKELARATACTSFEGRRGDEPHPAQALTSTAGVYDSTQDVGHMLKHMPGIMFPHLRCCSRRKVGRCPDPAITQLSATITLHTAPSNIPRSSFPQVPATPASGPTPMRLLAASSCSA